MSIICYQTVNKVTDFQLFAHFKNEWAINRQALLLIEMVYFSTLQIKKVSPSYWMP